MKKIIRNYNQLVDLFKKIKEVINKEPVTIEVEKLFKKRTNQQLKSFWMLVDVCKNYMNSFGNQFTSEEVKNYFLLKSEHTKNIKGVTVVKSISNKSDTTKEDMKKIIDYILDFGVENNIEDCYIDSEDLQQLLNYYD